MLIRSLRILSYMTEIRHFDQIFNTLKNFQRPFGLFLLTAYTAFSIYAVIGMFLFGGGVTRITMVPAAGDAGNFLYELLNFNDWYSSFVILFMIMVNNNWNNIADMYTDIFGNASRIYFCSYWVVMVLVFFNLFISIILEIYSSSGDEMEDSWDKMKLAKKLMPRFNSE